MGKINFSLQKNVQKQHVCYTVYLSIYGSVFQPFLVRGTLQIFKKNFFYE